MKNLATCKPSEFIAQTAKIKNAVKNWVEVIDLMKIRATKPVYLAYPIDATKEERESIFEQNEELKKKQAMENVNKILDNMLVSHPQETLNVLALCCFVEPEHVDDHSVDEYLQCIMEMVQNKSVVNFFSLLAHLQTPVKNI